MENNKDKLCTSVDGYYVITCDKVLIKANEIVPIGLI